MKTSMRYAMLTALTLSAGACAGGPQPEQMASADDGARIWRMTCAMCHNARPASEFDAQQWPVIVSHMRAVADLTRSDANAVAAFLAAAAASGNADTLTNGTQQEDE